MWLYMWLYIHVVMFDMWLYINEMKCQHDLCCQSNIAYTAETENSVEIPKVNKCWRLLNIFKMFSVFFKTVIYVSWNHWPCSIYVVKWIKFRTLYRDSAYIMWYCTCFPRADNRAMWRNRRLLEFFACRLVTEAWRLGACPLDSCSMLQWAVWQTPSSRGKIRRNVNNMYLHKTGIFKNLFLWRCLLYLTN